MELYKAAIDGNINDFKKLVEVKKYPIFEEVSAKGFLWTSLHYAMHYGKTDIINFCLKHAEKNNLLDYLVRCRSDDKRCPLMCLIRSNSLQLPEKNALLEKILDLYPRIYISQQVINECKVKKISDLILEKILKLKNDKSKQLMTGRNSTVVNSVNLTDNQIRDRVLTSSLLTDQKMSLYNATIEGNFVKLKSLVNDYHYSIFEEVSAKGYFWMCLHYAMHYGKAEIIYFILDFSEKVGKLDLVIRCKSNDNRCPLICLLKSHSVEGGAKSDILDNILNRYKKIYLSADVIKEMKAKGFEGLLKKHKRI